MLADISSGNTTLADWFFLIGFILFAVGFLTQIPSVRPRADEFYRLLVALGLAFVALGWLVL